MKKKKKVVILLLVAIIGIIGFTIAYFSQQINLENIFKTKKYKTILKEEFVSPDNWLPGDTTNKALTVINNGDIDQAVRVSYTEEWVSKDGTTILSNWIDENGNSTSHDTNVMTDEKVAVINFGNSGDWTKENGYFYYNYKLAPGEETTALIDSVTFNNKAKANVTCGSANVVNGETIIDCEAANTGYADATYKLTFKIDTVQYESYKDAWNIDLYITPGRLVVKNFVVNPVDTEYNEYTRGRMFAYEHEATEQTPALTDYRYIGEDPDNYVYFNCDDENDVETCEIWRIVGVFDVDDGTGNYEQRIKLIRGKQFSESMAWDENNVNDWTQSTLQQFLNGDYYNRTGKASTYGLKESTRNMVGYSKYYLGQGRQSNHEQMYNGERSTDIYNPEDDTWNCPNGPTEVGICSIRSLYWIGKIGLMYASDYFNSIDNQGRTWIFDSQLSDDNSTIYYFSWFLTPLYSSYAWYNGGTKEVNSPSNPDSYCVNGHLSGSYCFYGVRPVLYLKNNISVVSGIGTKDNPYVLSNNNDILINSYSYDMEYKIYKIGDEITYDNNKYYVINNSDKFQEYVTLLKADFLTSDEVNMYGNNFESINGEYPYYISNNCNASNEVSDNLIGCTTNYNYSNVKKLIDKWASKYDNDLIKVDGYKTRLLMVDELSSNLGYNKSYESTWNRYDITEDTPNWVLIPEKKYWTMSQAFWREKNSVFYVGENIFSMSVYTNQFIRPVINLNKCAINDGCTKY